MQLGLAIDDSRRHTIQGHEFVSIFATVLLENFQRCRQIHRHITAVRILFVATRSPPSKISTVVDCVAEHRQAKSDSSFRKNTTADRELIQIQRLQSKGKN